MNVRPAFHVSVRSAFHVLDIPLALILLAIVFVVGAIFALVYRDRTPGFSYFAGSMKAEK
jgi:hypothetical protein